MCLTLPRPNLWISLHLPGSYGVAAIFPMIPGIKVSLTSLDGTFPKPSRKAGSRAALQHGRRDDELDKPIV
jgi:hypothetical protein